MVPPLENHSGFRVAGIYWEPTHRSWGPREIDSRPRVELICQHRQQKVLETCPALFHGWGKACKLSPTRSWIKGYIFFIIFYCSGVHANIIPPLLSAEAPDATGPSLFCGPYSLPGCKVFCLGGPELMRPLLLLQLTFKLLVKWIKQM